MVLANESENLNRWTNEIDMDLKENKLTYQKSRLFVILALAIVEQVYELIRYIFVGSSDLSFVLKSEKSMTKFFMLIAIIIFRQKYEL